MFLVDGLSNVNGVSSEVRRIGEYISLGDALAAAERMISEFLNREFQPGMTRAALFERYRNSGEVPYIFRDDGMITTNLPGFNHLRFAFSTCAELCQISPSWIQQCA
jgi:hypothetical protein